MRPTLCAKVSLDLTELTVRLESQLNLRGKGAREGSWGARTSTLPAAALPLLCPGKQNYISQEAARPASPIPPRPAHPAPPRPAAGPAGI